VFRQHMQYGYWKALVIRKHRMPASFRHVVPGSFVGSVCLLMILGLFWSPALWATAGLLLLYASAALAVSLLIAASSEWVLLPVLPLVLGCYHFGYGYGFLRGVLDLVLLHNAPATQFVQLTRKRALKPVASIADPKHS